jgi:hypothetical protein
MQLQLLERADDGEARAEAIAELRAGIERSQKLIDSCCALHVRMPAADSTPMRVSSPEFWCMGTTSNSLCC